MSLPMNTKIWEIGVIQQINFVDGTDFLPIEADTFENFNNNLVLIKRNNKSHLLFHIQNITRIIFQND